MKNILKKNILKAFLYLALTLSPLSHSYAISVVASVKPLQLIALEITQGVLEPERLVNSTASPHNYSLKPSDLAKVRNADLLIWFGSDLEAFLVKAIGDGDNSLQLSQSLLSLRKYNDVSHDGQHESYDPHIWLGPLQAKQAAKAISSALSEIDKDNAAVYETNYEHFSNQLKETVHEIKTQLMPYQNKGYYVFHDAYGYFESYFQLNKVGYFTLSPDRKPGAKTLVQIRHELKKGEIKCMFSEPQFKPAIVESVTRGSDVYIGILDPLATDVEPSKGAYFQFLRTLAKSYTECLAY